MILLYTLISIIDIIYDRNIHYIEPHTRNAHSKQEIDCYLSAILGRFVSFQSYFLEPSISPRLSQSNPPFHHPNPDVKFYLSSFQFPSFTPAVFEQRFLLVVLLLVHLTAVMFTYFKFRLSFRNICP